jgi:hypothetical protein
MARHKVKREALQGGKVKIGCPDKFLEDSHTFRRKTAASVEAQPSKGDLAHAIAVSKSGTHAPNGAVSDASNEGLVIDGDRQTTRQDRHDMAWFLRPHGDA